MWKAPFTQPDLGISTWAALNLLHNRRFLAGQRYLAILKGTKQVFYSILLYCWVPWCSSASLLHLRYCDFTSREPYQLSHAYSDLLFARVGYWKQTHLEDLNVFRHAIAFFLSFVLVVSVSPRVGFVRWLFWVRKSVHRSNLKFILLAPSNFAKPTAKSFYTQADSTGLRFRVGIPSAVLYCPLGL